MASRYDEDDDDIEAANEAAEDEDVPEASEDAETEDMVRGLPIHVRVADGWQCCGQGTPLVVASFGWQVLTGKP